MNKAKLKKSIVAGLAVESLFVLPLAFSGFGPCGPNNPIGLLAILLQLPFLALAVFIGKAIGASDQAFMVLTFLFGWAAWAALSYLLLSLKERKAGNVNAESGNPK